MWGRRQHVAACRTGCLVKQRVQSCGDTLVYHAQRRRPTLCCRCTWLAARAGLPAGKRSWCPSHSLLQGPGFLILAILGWVASKVLDNPPDWLQGLVAGEKLLAGFPVAVRLPVHGPP